MNHLIITLIIIMSLATIVIFLKYLSEIAYIFYNKGSWSGIYWQKVSDKDWTTSMELNILCGVSKEKFLAWAEKNNNLRNEVH